MITDVLKILILEDNDADAEMIMHILQRKGKAYEFKVVMKNHEFTNALDEFKPDVILSDNALPQFSASEALEIVKERALHVPFILVTGTVSEEFAASIIKAGADDYLLKDRLARLPAAIEAALKQKQTEKQKQEAEEKLVQNEKRFRALVENNDGIISLVDDKMISVFRSSSAARITGWTNEEFAKVDTREYIHPHDVANLQELTKKVMSNPGVPFPISFRAKHKNGHYIWLEGVINNMIHDADVRGLITNLRDVTERVEAENKIVKANRLYFFISQINQMIVRTTDETILFKDACKIAVEVGKFRMAWIGMIDEKTKKVIPVMHAGEEREFLSKIKIIKVDDSPEGMGPTALALKQGKRFICNDIENDPGMAPWKEAAAGRGYLSSMAIPLTKFGKITGVFCFYASEKNFFDATEVGLLEEAAGDVSFALDILGKEELRKKAEEEVLESERRYQTLTEVSPVGIFHTDEVGYTTYVNPRWCQISGLSLEEGIGNGWLNAVHEEDKELLSKGWEEATKTQRISVSEYRFVRPDGKVTWVMGQAIPERNAENNIIGYVGTITDITERKLAEKQTVKERDLSDKIINSLPGIFYLANQTPQLVRWNKALEKISGYTETEIEKIQPISLFDPEDHEVLRKGLEKSYKEGMADVEVRLLTKSGQRIPFYFTGVSVEYEGKPAVMGIGIDISERKKAQDEIINEKNISDSIINSLPGIFYLYNKEGQFLRWNTNFEKVTLYNAEEIKHLHPLELFDDDEKELLTQKIANVFLAGEDNVQANLLIKGRNKVPYYFTGIAIDYEGSPCLMGVGIDFSERKKAQEEIKETSEKLRQLTAHLLSVREEERKRIGREIHDELGQQLTAIKMDVSWIDKKTPAESALIKDKLKNIITLLDGSNQSIRRILSELRPGILDDYGLIEALEWHNRQFASNTGIPVNFVTTEKDLKLPEPVSTCIFRVYQEALTNITRYAHANKVSSSITIEKNEVVVTIKDDGEGFDVKAAQSKKSFGILGMKERVFSLGGNFELVSFPGKGTKITIRLPYLI